MPPLRPSPATRRLALQVASGAACGCFAFGLLTHEQQRQQQPAHLLEKEEEVGGGEGGRGSLPPQQPQQQQQPPPPPPPPSAAGAAESRANWIRRQFTTRRQSMNSEEHDMEWTPEGGGSGVQQQQQQRRAAVRRRATAAIDGDEGQQQQQQQDGTKKKAWKKSLEEAAAAGGRGGGGGEYGEGGERGDGSEGGATTAARMLKQLQAWETRPPGPCDKYNALTSRFLTWQTRRKECNAAPDCLFVGRSVTGWCIPEEEASLYEMPYDDKATAEDDEDQDQDQGGDYYSYIDDDDDDDNDGLSLESFPSPDDPEGPMVETELLQSLVTIIRQEGIEQPVRLLITGRLADAMADSLKDGQTGSKELAKALVMEVLTDPESPHALKHILAQPGLRASIRQSLHALCYLPYTKQEAHRLLKQQLDWLLIKNRMTEETLGWTFHQLLLSKKTHEALVPLLTWTFSEDGPVVEPLTKLTSQTLVPMLEEVTTYGLKVGAQYALESEYVRGMAKEGVKDVLLRVARVAAQKREEAEEERRRLLRERGGGGRRGGRGGGRGEGGEGEGEGGRAGLCGGAGGGGGRRGGGQ